MKGRLFFNEVFIEIVLDSFAIDLSGDAIASELRVTRELHEFNLVQWIQFQIRRNGLIL